MWVIFKHNVWQLSICLSQLLCCIICLCIGYKAWADCSLCAQAYIWDIKHSVKWPRVVLDVCFLWMEKEHCKVSYKVEMDRGHVPCSMRG